ncbi:hypothetical protein PCANC_16466 [Puccinia coronata f. sp. avenae]|uniref:Secreted protein n=1 Tax=Puccinia coronata f. sp. avenae TaxID=200324 RepID=A0A2N5U6Z7_9BASI|nr:hypothetical protein PCANC_22707 [Puccinia coronata f. sp. avenae]PLW33500.1 hypothetical protein PCANC_16466 [Puccinia coronata f. sp. avenae]
MIASSLAVLCALSFYSFSYVVATEHTGCYNFYLKKDKCVPAANDPKIRACPNITAPGQTFKFQGPQPHSGKLTKRYDTALPPYPIGSLGGRGPVCRKYDSDNEFAVCLYNGPDHRHHAPAYAGWLNEGKKSNCGKRVYVMRGGDHPDKANTQYATVVEGCDFPTKDWSVGCAQIGLSNKLFAALKPTKKESDQGFLDGSLIWNFDSDNGQHTQQGPV